MLSSAGSEPPLQLGRYTLFRAIASGGMASVHFGRLIGPAGFARTVAIKRMHPQCAKEPDFVAMFMDEARLASRVQHPNVVPTLDVVATQGELFLVMEYVRGESLARLVRCARERGERLPPRVVASILIGVLHGLHAAHEARSERGDPLSIVHRDVSAQNVIVGVDGVARVADFGVAKAVGRIHTTHGDQPKGKLATMAPEQIRSGPVDRRTDVYAAGVVLWEALTGERLFAGDVEVQTINNVLSAPVRAPSEVARDLPPALDGVVLRAVERDPTFRFATAREMALALQSAIDAAPATEVSDLVERLAHEALNERARIVADIERDSSAAPALEDVLEHVQGTVARATPSETTPPRARRKSPWLVAAVASLLAALVSWSMFTRTATSTAVAASPPAATSVMPNTSIVTAPTEATSAPPVPVPSAAIESPRPITSQTSTPTRSAAPRARPRREVDKSNKCDPPWFIDGAGVKKWKPECR